MSRSPMKIFVAVFCVLSLILLAVVYFNDRHTKEAGGYYCFNLSDKIERKIYMEKDNREHNINQNVFFYGNNPDEKESYVKNFNVREERKNEEK